MCSGSHREVVPGVTGTHTAPSIAGARVLSSRPHCRAHGEWGPALLSSPLPINNGIKSKLPPRE